MQNRAGVNATGNRTGNQPRGFTPPRGGTDYGAGANPRGIQGGNLGQRAANYRQVNQGF